MNYSSSAFAQVAPVSELVGHLPHSTPQILINRDPVAHHQFDVALLGNCDDVVQHLCARLDEPDAQWKLPAATSSVPLLQEPEEVAPRRLGDSHVLLFPGANVHHKWLRQFDPEYQRATEGGLSLSGSRARSRSRSRSPSPSASRRSKSRSRSPSNDPPRTRSKSPQPISES